MANKQRISINLVGSDTAVQAGPSRKRKSASKAARKSKSRLGLGKSRTMSRSPR